MDRTCLVLGLLWLLVQHSDSQTGPGQCLYSEEVYTCDYTLMSSSERPVNFYGFSVQPQQLVLEVNGLLPYFGDSITFTTGFSTSLGMDVSSFNENYPASLTLDCGRQGSVYIYSSAFYFMEYVEHFKIRNCDILYIGADAFVWFDELDSFSFEGGSIDQIEFTTMSGLTLKKMNTTSRHIPRTHGKVEIINTQFVYGVITPWLLTFLTSVTSIILKNDGISFISSGQFTTNIMVRVMDLSDNIFPTLPKDVFDHLNGLSEVTMYNLPWGCNCEDLKWLKSVIKNNILLTGDFMCGDKNGVSVFKYYDDNCATADVCKGITGVAYGDKCLSIFNIATVSFGCLAFICTCASLVIAIINYRSMVQPEELDPVVLDRMKRKAKQRWLKACRTIIYAKRTGRQLTVFESKSSIQTMSIPDETRTPYDRNSRNTFESSIPDFNSLNGSYFNNLSSGHSDSPDSYGRMHRVHSMSDASYAGFPSEMDHPYQYRR